MKQKLSQKFSNTTSPKIQKLLSNSEQIELSIFKPNFSFTLIDCVKDDSEQMDKKLMDKKMMDLKLKELKKN